MPFCTTNCLATFMRAQGACVKASGRDSLARGREQVISKTQAECGDIEVKDKKIERRRILAFASAKKEKVGKAKNFPNLQV